MSRGYEVEIVSSVVFKRGRGLFDSFINTQFTSKAQAKAEDLVGELIEKLLMNSFYGKSKLEVENTYAMIESDHLEEYGKKHEYDLSQDFDKLTLIREKAGSMDPTILKLLNPEKAVEKDSVRGGSPKSLSLTHDSQANSPRVSNRLLV
jgi:hypothetical protein